MLKKLYPLLAYINYFLRKEDRHSLQSPYLFRLYEDLQSFKKGKDDEALLATRKRLLSDQQKITIEDFGTGSIHLKHPVRKIADITRHSTSPTKFSKLYQYFCSLTPAKNVIELGTCVGINTCYLAQSTNGQLHTFEGAKELAKLAQQTFSGFSNVHLVLGRIEETLPTYLENRGMIDFALMDAHHAYTPTIEFWNHILPCLSEKSIVAIGDIHRSKGMQKAWEEIKHHPNVTLSIDFYECGILIFKKGLKKQDYILDY